MSKFRKIALSLGILLGLTACQGAKSNDPASEKAADTNKDTQVEETST